MRVSGASGVAGSGAESCGRLCTGRRAFRNALQGPPSAEDAIGWLAVAARAATSMQRSRGARSRFLRSRTAAELNPGQAPSPRRPWRRAQVARPPRDGNRAPTRPPPLQGRAHVSSHAEQTSCWPSFARVQSMALCRSEATQMEGTCVGRWSLAGSWCQRRYARPQHRYLADTGSQLPLRTGQPCRRCPSSRRTQPWSDPAADRLPCVDVSQGRGGVGDVAAAAGCATAAVAELSS